MIGLNEVTEVLARCTGYASDRVPVPSEAVLIAWRDHFAQFPHLTRDDALQAVEIFFREPRHGGLIQAADISKIARDVHQDRMLREPVAELPAAEHDSRDDHHSSDDEHPPGDPCAVDECCKASTFAEFCARHYVLSKVGLVGKSL